MTWTDLDCSKIPVCFHSASNPFIGIKGCTVPDVCPTSGYFINDLAGMSYVQGAKSANEHLQSGQALYENSIRRAILTTCNNVLNGITSFTQFRFSTLLNNYNVGIWKPGQYTAANPLLKRGLRITKQSNNLTTVVINSVTINVTNFTGIVNVFVEDDSGTYNYLQNVTSGTQIYDVPINYTSYSDTVYIYISNTPVDVNSSTLSQSCSGCGYNNHGVSIQGWNDTTTSNLTYGIKANISLECNAWGFLCAIKQRMANLVLLKAAIFVMEERMLSQRKTDATLNKEDISAFITRWDEQYEKELKVVVESLYQILKSNTFAPCVSCRGAKVVTEVL